MQGVCEPRDTPDWYQAQFFIDDIKGNSPYRIRLVNLVLMPFAGRMRHEHAICPASFPKFHEDHLRSGWNSEMLEQWNYIGKDEDVPIKYLKFHIVKYDGSNGNRRGLMLAMQKEGAALDKMRFLCEKFNNFLELYSKERILAYDGVKNFDNLGIPGLILD